MKVVSKGHHYLLLFCGAGDVDEEPGDEADGSFFYFESAEFHHFKQVFDEGSRDTVEHKVLHALFR